MAVVVPYLLVEGLTKSVGSKVLFQDISFAINEGQRIALIARNGIGKSTLLNILAGQTDYDGGKITFRNGIKVAYLSQIISLPNHLTIKQYCDQADNALRVQQLLTQLQITDTTLTIDKLSGGQQKRVAIAKVLAEEPDLLIMDEPTNHLDLQMVIWLENYLRKSSITLLMVTHDRYFLDSVCTNIWELDQYHLYEYVGNYTAYLEARAERIENQNAEIDKYRNLYRTELEWMRRMPQARAHKARYRIDNFYEIEKKAKQTIQEQNVQLNIKSTYIGNKIFEAKNVSKRFVGTDSNLADKVILDDFSYVFTRYEKLGIIGNNGTGKSTFLKLLLGYLQPDSGVFDVGTTVRFGYYAQTGLTFQEDKKVIDVVRDIAEMIDLGNGNKLTAGQLLQHFLFSPSQQHDFVAKLSGGEKQRLHLCTVLMRNPNFLILDEPTNDLDIPTLQVLEEYLKAYQGCLILVSHDRYFMDRVVDHIFVFEGDGKVKDFPGNYTQYRLSEAEKVTSTSKDNNKPTVKPKQNNSTATRKLTFKEKQELQILEQELPALEEEKATLEQQLSGVQLDALTIQQVSTRYEEVKRLLDEKEFRWLELSEYSK
ncbi:MAG: ABC-F family ATP-binding cassette domain-containing protein [Paludibacteraceae bacterium]|nr:ABC-F family ATP-binding cassette domain-containing protein [Paludibacteraceae bacterium]